MQDLYDVIVIGGGPAGLTGALYLARARYRVLVLEKDRIGGQIAITEEVVNYPGIDRTSGAELTQTMRRQAEAFGAEFLSEEAVELDLGGSVKTVRTPNRTLKCLGLLLATGARPRPVGFLGEETYRGRGVAYCATCDGEFFTGKDVFVVGGGYAAAEESIFLTKFARHVTILVRKGDFSCAASVAEKAKNHEKITVLTHTVLEEVRGEPGLNYARYRNTATGEVTEYHAKPGENFGVFVLAGYAPETELVKNLVDLDAGGYLITDRTGMTSVPGVYAAGDVCAKPLRQVVTATGDGALAATELEKYVAELQHRTGLRAEPRKAPADRKPKGDFSQETRKSLEELFEKMGRPLALKLRLDQRPVSRELERFVEELASMTEKLTVIREEGADAPCVCVCGENGEPTGLAFHGVPGGHEFTSFVMGLYHASGRGKPLEPEIRERIRGITRPVDLKILVTLSCSLCPETVIAAQRIAAENPHVTAHVYDAAHFPDLRERYQVMSVPCIVVDDREAFFGRKNIAQILDLLKERK